MKKIWKEQKGNHEVWKVRVEYMVKTSLDEEKAKEIVKENCIHCRYSLRCTVKDPLNDNCKKFNE